jgi:hypothetical protein
MGCQLLVQLTQIEQTIDLPHQMIGSNYPIEIKRIKETGLGRSPRPTCAAPTIESKSPVMPTSVMKAVPRDKILPPALGVWVYGCMGMRADDEASSSVAEMSRRMFSPVASQWKSTTIAPTAWPSGCASNSEPLRPDPQPVP